MVIPAVSLIETKDWSRQLAKRGEIVFLASEAPKGLEHQHVEKGVRLLDWAQRMGYPVECPDSGDFVRVRRKAA